MVPSVAAAVSVVKAVATAAPELETKVLIVAPPFGLPNTSNPDTLRTCEIPAAAVAGAVKVIEFNAPAVPCT